MSEKPYQSCLEPFNEEIIALRRRKRPMSYAKIVKYLQDKHQITVHRQTVYDFLKVRAKGFKPCKFAWNIEPVSAANQPTTEVPQVLIKPEVSPIRETPKPAADKPKISELASRPFEMEFSETYNLTRLPFEEAEAMNKIIEEKRKQFLQKIKKIW